MIDPEKRESSWKKARPIAPQTKHPMGSLFHKTGRAWSYITSNMARGDTVLNHGGHLIEFLEKTVQELSPIGEIRFAIDDIEGCFPNMPKDAIKTAMRQTLREITTTTGHDSISVPSKKSVPCTFKVTKKRGYTTITFEELIDIMDFALENTVVQDFDGKLRKQCKGIPMGDPHSPGMTIGTCAWMETAWMESNNIKDKPLRIKRYMDDVLTLYAVNGQWDHDEMIKSLREQCYLPPLKLEKGGEDTFLETQFEIKNNRLKYWIKNENRAGAPAKVWRYSHISCYTPFELKKRTMMATLRKVHKMASDTYTLRKSAQQKIAEFIRLKYPVKTLWTACTTMGVTTRDTAWFKVRDLLQ